jgi:hypothetical protein
MASLHVILRLKMPLLSRGKVFGMVQWKRYHPVQAAVNERGFYSKAVISRLAGWAHMHAVSLSKPKATEAP